MSLDFENNSPAKPSSLGKRIARGGMVLSAARLASRALGVISALTVPRWLGPEEMGIFAVAMLALAAIDAFTQSGYVAAFMQRKTDYEKFILPIRTFNVFRGLALGIIIFLAAPYVADFMQVPRATGVLRALALSPVLTGLIPMIWVLADKRLRFGYAAKFNVFMTIVNLSVTLPLAWHLKSSWALVWGMLLANLVGALTSTLLSPEGRGLTFAWSPLKELQGFGFWIFLTTVAAYLYINGGNWLIGNLLDVKTLAVYTLAYKFCTMFTSEAAGVINQMMLPVFSLIQDDFPRLQTGFRKSFGILAMIVVGVGVLFCVAARDYFIIVLGGKWADYVTLFNNMLPWLTLWGISSAFAGAQSGVFQALGKPHWWLWTLVAMCVLMLALIWPAVNLWGAVGVAAVLGSVAAAMQIVRYFILAHILHLRFLQVAAHVVVPVVAGVIAVTVATLLREILTSSAWVQALLASSVAVAVYFVTVLALARYMHPNPIPLIHQAWNVVVAKVRKVMA